MYTKLRFDERFNKKIEKLIERGEFKIGPSGRLIAGNPQGAKNIPWIFLNLNTRHKFCGIWNSIYCGRFHLIPSPCRFGCWKVVIKPKTLKELFVVYEVLKSLDLPSKCGMDLRDYTYGAWAGFIYADTLPEGRRYYQAIRELISDDISIILKRGCTEMERLKPSLLWDNFSQDDLFKEQQLNDVFEFSEMHFTQGEWLKARIKERWIRHAIAIGDTTAEEMAVMLTKNPEIWNHLVVDSIKYQDVPEEKKENDDNGRK